MTNPFALKRRLPHTWTPFFARHGNFTPVQQAAMPPILEGRNVLVVAATASGKTEAAIVPLLERHCLAKPRTDAGPALRILYICPTRALVRDLYERLRQPFAALGVSLAMKSGDTGPVSTTRPPTVLITTPESTDSLLTRAPRLLAELQAVVLDEIHLFDGGPRGDHLRCLLRRVEHIRAYRQAQAKAAPTPLQRIALSATVPDPAGVAARYLAGPGEQPPLVVQVPGKRDLTVDLRSMDDLDDLVAALADHAAGPQAVQKTLVFCNTRSEVEQTAAYLRQHLPYAAQVFAHYSNLDPALRREVEDGFAQASVAVCVSSSTLELGVDIGDIDEVALVGPPPTLSSFLQRIGRGGRRTGRTQVLCLARTPPEEIRFRALVALASGERPLAGAAPRPQPPPFLPSVLVQQIFSILAQSPTGALRLADLRRIAPEEVADETLQAILAHLVRLRYLRSGRLGEWRPGPALDELVDAHEIYSNIGGDPLAVTLVDAFTGRALAQISRARAQEDILQLGGYTLAVVWRDRYRVGVRRVEGGPISETLQFRAAPFAVPLEVSQAVARYAGLSGGEVAFVGVEEGGWLFHFWGDVYGALLAEVLRQTGGVEPALITPVNEHCIFVPGTLERLPPWQPGAVKRAVQRLAPRVEPLLGLGRFHNLLPPAVARQAVREQMALPHFQALYKAAQVRQVPQRSDLGVFLLSSLL